jgi:hypothetical protein
VRPGTHPPILSEEEFRDATRGVESRKRHTGKRPPTSKRLYLLRGLVFCSCGARMQGDAARSRGSTWTYYSCPVAAGRRAIRDADGNIVECHARRVPAQEAERLVVDRLRELMVPEERIAAARAELAERLRAPQPGTADKERERLTTRLGKLADLFGWGDLSEGDYRRQVAEVRAQLSAIPGTDSKLVAFDDYRARAAEMRSFAEMVDSASGDKVQELLPWLIARVETADKQVVRIVPTDAARPFFAWAGDAGDCAGVAPPDGLEPPTQALGRPRSVH